MTNTREGHRQGPPRVVIILLALFVIGLLLQASVAFAQTELPTAGNDSNGASGAAASVQSSVPAPE